ncbi:MAG: cytochrome c [Microcella pacifica]|jgi:ubiquinol-cytochrome c reductase cytochrome c subunit|uniref:cytochrome bc1 complex diheme cytochrome c subunit n=1 Tax=Microcella TaxID=337004 RepID=UPI0015CF7049|nr:cytochrome c [Microcella indica]MBU1251932.1 c-type cytochrome [Actinomycetota bacterium]MBU1609881.1 c-type cytochrome [Actinomycetota bacterium]MBU2315978.1 c-type cytochrome [Actinomycetota bacterium]MBU2385142.1 c-type cytochrome [Actinomycetota bacterium]
MALTSAASPRRAGRRSPLATTALLVVGLLATGGAYALVTASATADAKAASAQIVEEGGKLFATNCASCHGLLGQGTAAGPSVIGVGALAVDFQVGTGRMPLAASGPQAEVKPAQFTQEQIDAMAAWVAELAPGPAIPADRYVEGDGNAANGAQLFRTNCAMCHNVAGAGGALTEGKWAPGLANIDPVYVYAAMVTGPQNMPVFSDLNLSPEEKNDIITYLRYIDENPSVGGFDLGSLGPVSEGLFIWIFGLGGLVAVTIWLTAKSN